MNKSILAGMGTAFLILGAIWCLYNIIVPNNELATKDCEFYRLGMFVLLLWNFISYISQLLRWASKHETSPKEL